VPVKPNIAVVGCGYWGPNLIRNFNGLPDCRVKTVCDADEARLNHIRTLYNGSIETTPSFERVLNDPEIQAVAIATPIRTHYELARRCLEAGKHAFVEKPLASSVDECRKLVALAEERGLTLMVGHTFIYTPAVRYIKKAIEDGVLGSIYYVSSQRLNLGLFQRDINVAWDLAPHDISILLYILQDVPKAINCQGKAHVVPGLEDITNISIDFNNGTFATVQSSWLDPNKIRKMTIVGSKAMIVYDDVEPNEKIRIYDKRVETPPHYDTFAEFQYSYHYGDMRVPYIRQVEPLKTECQHFLDCIATGARSESSGVEGLRVVQILEASSHSLRNGGSRIELPVE
jgi:predicted dehydrogenase